MQANRGRVMGYLPQDRPPLGALVSLGFQHVLTMFPATVLVAILTGFDVEVTLFASGLATIVAVLGSRGRIPLYYGGSFAYIAPVKTVADASWGGLQVAQVGVVATGVVNGIVGWLIQRAGKARLDRILPPAVTGAVAVVIGIALAKTAMDMASKHWGIALATLVLTILFSVYLQGRGLWGMLPVLLGAACGYALAAAMGYVDLTPVREAPWFAVPRFQLPAFTAPGAWQAVLAIAPVAIATIPESTAHLYQISLYVDRLAEEMQRPPLRIKELIGLNLVLDGLADVVHGLLGASSGTNYGENNSLMAITRNYSTAVLVAAGVIAMALGFFSKLAALVATIPEFVTGGLAIYLFGVIGMQGIALMMAERVNLFDPRQLAIGAVILVIGIGGNAFEGGNIPVGGVRLPAIATAAVAGILLNLLFLALDGRRAGGRGPAGAPSRPAPASAGDD
ncbi:xanthine permease [Thermaerobacter sp. FW80]|uniref:uracil-xanthine permease family protein n=1 Tax=Thermaerobacter sp. FW80 TaxID=2546351 RepID=UPI001075040C|nr:solute carrier family 23 protein [Thermaerobacter sp. FW80]QBS38189.1 xanthine permease [Thermaerobacter sp. FW80]